MQLILYLQDESKLDALLDALRRFAHEEGVELAVENRDGVALLETSPNGLDEAKWDDLMSRDKLRPGQPRMSPDEEEQWIADQIREVRTEEEEDEFINQAIKETRARMRAAL